MAAARLILLVGAAFLPFADAAGDPVEALFRSMAMTARQLGEKLMANIPLPNVNDIENPYSGMYSLDRKTINTLSAFSDFFNTCPAPLYTDISGAWAIIFASERLLQTLFQDVDEAVNRLAASQPLSGQKSLISLFRADVDFQCAAVVANDGAFELTYSAKGPKSIIGKISVNNDMTMEWQFAPTAKADFAVIYTTQLVEKSSKDIAVLAQIGKNMPSNRLLPINCAALQASNLLQPTIPQRK